jgi:hypothetical protein
MAIPDHGRLALVGDPDSRDVTPTDPRTLESGSHHLLRAFPNLHRIVFDPSRLRVDLLMLALIHRDDIALAVEDHGSRARCPLVDRQNEATHDRTSLRFLQRSSLTPV